MSAARTIPVADTTPLSLFRRIVGECDRFEAQWRAGAKPKIEEFTAAAAAAERPLLLRKLLELEIDLRLEAGEQPAAADYGARLPDDVALVAEVFAEVRPVGGKGPRRTRALGPGQLVGEYELLDLLGRGGMGVVFKARRQGTIRVVALKLILPELLDLPADEGGDELVARFQTEARAAAGLKHDHIVPVYEVGFAGGLHYYAMQLIAGPSLAGELRGGPLPGRRAAAILVPIARAVQHAHEHLICHRDLKPRNILLDVDGRPYVTDFGLARDLAGGTQLTPSGARLGTPAYMAPELAGGRAAGPPADIYSLGATLYECLTGRPPFHGADPIDVLRRVLDEDPPRPRRLNPAISPELETVCLKCLRKDPARRYRSAAELADDLQRVLDNRRIVARTESLIERTRQAVRRRPARSLLAALLLAAGPAIGAGIWAADRRIETTRIRALVAELVSAEPSEVPRVVADLRGAGPRAGGALRAAFADSPVASSTRLRTALALVHFDSSVADDLFEWALDAAPGDLRLIRDQLDSRLGERSPRLWTLLASPDAPAERRLRAACLLAVADPRAEGWQTCAADVAAQLAAAGTQPAAWSRLLGPVRDPLRPALERAYRQRQAAARAHAAAAALAELYADAPAALVEFLLDGDVSQCCLLMPALERHSATERLLRERLGTTDPGPGDVAASDDWAARRANVAAALLRLRPAGEAWRELGRDADARVRAVLLHRLAPLQVPAAEVVHRLTAETDPAARQALLLALGEYAPDLARGEGRTDGLRAVRQLFRDDPDPGVHSAAQWLLHRWGDADHVRDVTAAVAGTGPRAGRGWFVSPGGQTFAVLDLPAADGPARRVAIATTEVTLAQYRQFRADHKNGHDDAAGPVDSVRAYDAVDFCNWLSQKEKISADQWCYDSAAAPREKIVPRPGFPKLTGYRLPTRAELDAAARLDPQLRRFFAAREGLFGNYAWFVGNARQRTWPVGALKPGDAGLFDTLGNVGEWTADRHVAGGHELFWFQACNMIQQSRTVLTRPWVAASPANRAVTLGFRVARTLGPGEGLSAKAAEP